MPGARRPRGGRDRLGATRSWANSTRRNRMKTIAAVLAVSVAAVGAATAGAGTGRTAGGVTTVHVVLGKPSEMRFMFDRTSVPHGTVVFQLINKGVVPHDLRIDRRTSPLV